jgi:hypothetical protein
VEVLVSMLVGGGLPSHVGRFFHAAGYCRRNNPSFHAKD